MRKMRVRPYRGGQNAGRVGHIGRGVELLTNGRRLVRVQVGRYVLYGC